MRLLNSALYRKYSHVKNPLLKAIIVEWPSQIPEYDANAYWERREEKPSLPSYILKKLKGTGLTLSRSGAYWATGKNPDVKNLIENFDKFVVSRKERILDEMVAHKRDRYNDEEYSVNKDRSDAQQFIVFINWDNDERIQKLRGLLEKEKC